MKDFLVVKKTFYERKDDVYIGIAPGKFDTKQLVLCSLAILANDEEKNSVFVRTLDKEELKKCSCFINDDFVSLMPMIPSFFDIAYMWNKKYVNILKKFSVYYDVYAAEIRDLLIDKLCDLSSMDCLMQLYDPDMPDHSFEKTLRLSLGILSERIKKAVKDISLIPTINCCIKEAIDNYIYIPLYTENWRETVLLNPKSANIQYVIMPDDDCYIVGSMDEDFLMRKHIKGIPNVAYSGKFYAKVADMNTAEKLISKLPKKENIIHKTHKYA